MAEPLKADITPTEFERAKQSFPGSPHQRYLHNRLLVKLKGAQSGLETCTDEELAKCRLKLRAWREFMEFLHEFDSPATRELFYENT